MFGNDDARNRPASRSDVTPIRWLDQTIAETRILSLDITSAKVGVTVSGGAARCLERAGQFDAPLLAETAGKCSSTS
jgi:hypothetical protein